MSAVPARIGFILNMFRTSVRTSPVAKARYGEAARDTAPDIVETFFDDVAAADAMNAERIALLGADRRRFMTAFKGAGAAVGELDVSQRTPTIQIVDDERSANHSAAIVQLSVDVLAETTTVTTWG